MATLNHNILAHGIVVDVMKQGAYRIALANGHRCIAKASGTVRLDFVKFSPGDKVSIEFHPYDLSRGRIIG